MTTNNSNGKAKRQNYSILTLQSAGEGEVKYAASGKPWGKIRAFFSQGKDQQTGEFLPSIWFTVKAFSKDDEPSQAVSALQNIAKGDKFTVKGRLGMDQWEGSDGTTHQSLTIFAISIEPFVIETEAEELEGEPA
jgi:single-stranded DNA-binding protein